MREKKVLLAGLLLLAGLGAWLFYHFSDRQVIKRRFAALAVELAKEGEETPVQLALKMKPVKEFLAPACEVSVPERNYRETLDPALAIRYLIMYRARHATIRLEIEELGVELSAKDRAEASLLVHLVADEFYADALDERHRLEFSLVRQEKKWLLARATLPEELVRQR